MRQAQAVKQKTGQSEKTENGENEKPALRIIGKSMHRGQHAGAHEKCARQRQRKGDDGQEQCPTFQRVAFFSHQSRMQQGRARQPRHERGVFYRIPKPKTAPTQFVIGPIRTERDAQSQKNPSRQNPRAHAARPILPVFFSGERGQRKSISHRKAYISGIEQWWMRGQSGILQNRCEPLPAKRRRQ